MRRQTLVRITTVLLAAGASLVFALPLASQDAGPEPQAKSRAVRVMTYNIKHGTGNVPCIAPPATTPPAPDCGNNLALTAAAIREQAPDIVTLQEVDRFWSRSAYTDQPAALAAALGMHQCYGANLDHPKDRHSDVPHQYGTAILSRFPILDCRNTFLPSTRPATDTSGPVRREQRGLLDVLINVRGVPLRVYNTHLEHTTAYTDVRTAQINAAIELIGAFEEDTLLTGDLNARPNASEMQPLFAIFNDAWTLANPGASGYTIPAALVGSPTRRIDYLLLSTDIEVTGAAVPITPVTRSASDHYPVWADLLLPGAHVGVGQ